MTRLEGRDLDAPLLVQRSRAQVLAGLAFGVPCVTLMIIFTREPLRGPALLMGAIFLVICSAVSLIEVADRLPRLILKRDGLHWRPTFGPLVWTRWCDVQTAGIRDRERNHGLCWLELTITTASSSRHEVSIKLDRMTLDGDEVLEAIRARAPHLFPGAARNALDLGAI